MVVAKFILPPPVATGVRHNKQRGDLNADSMLALQQQRDHAEEERALQQAAADHVAQAEAMARERREADSRRHEHLPEERAVQERDRKTLLAALSITEHWEPPTTYAFGSSVKLDRPQVPPLWYKTGPDDFSPGPLMLHPRMPLDVRQTERVKVDLELAQKRGKGRLGMVRQRVRRATPGGDRTLELGMKLPLDSRAGLTLSRIEDRLKSRISRATDRLAEAETTATSQYHHHYSPGLVESPSVVFRSLDRPASPELPAWLRTPSRSSQEGAEAERRQRPQTSNARPQKSDARPQTSGNGGRGAHLSTVHTAPTALIKSAPASVTSPPQAQATPPWSPWGACSSSPSPSAAACRPSSALASPPLARRSRPDHFQRMLEQSGVIPAGSPSPSEFARLDGSTVSGSLFGGL